MPLARSAIVLVSSGLFVIAKPRQSPEHVQSSVEFSGASIVPTDFVPTPENDVAELAGAVALAAVLIVW